MAKPTKHATPAKKRTPGGARTATPRKSAAATTRKGSRANTDSEKQKVTARAPGRAVKKPASKRSRPPNRRHDELAPDVIFVEVIEEVVPDIVILTDVETVLLDSDEALAELIQEEDDAGTLEPKTKQR